MINWGRLKRYCKDDISLIENYEEAVNDKTQTWHCHHRKETNENLSVYELKRLGLYWHRPAKELIFLTPFEHNTLHNKGERHPNYGKLAWNNSKHLSKEHKRKLSEANKGKNKGKTSSFKGKYHSEETKKKIGAAHKGKHKVWDDKEHNKYHFEKN